MCEIVYYSYRLAQCSASTRANTLWIRWAHHSEKKLQLECTTGCPNVALTTLFWWHVFSRCVYAAICTFLIVRDCSTCTLITNATKKITWIKQVNCTLQSIYPTCHQVNTQKEDLKIRTQILSSSRPALRSIFNCRTIGNCDRMKKTHAHTNIHRHFVKFDTCRDEDRAFRIQNPSKSLQRETIRACGATVRSFQECQECARKTQTHKHTNDGARKHTHSHAHTIMMFVVGYVC